MPSELVIQTRVFQPTEKHAKMCVACGNSIMESGLKVSSEKETHDYDCYRNLWSFKKKLKELQDTGGDEGLAVVRVLIGMIESGMSVNKANIYFKFWKKHGSKFVGPAKC